MAFFSPLRSSTSPFLPSADSGFRMPCDGPVRRHGALNRSSGLVSRAETVWFRFGNSASRDATFRSTWSCWIPFPARRQAALQGLAAAIVRECSPLAGPPWARGGSFGMVRDKVRIRFRKTGDLRLISHHDLLRSFERLLRRAAVPFHSTQGFNPKPRLVFALPLPLGVIGCEEVVELELDAELAPQDLQERLAQHAPIGLEILTLQRIDRRTTAHVRQVTYRIAVPPEQATQLPERLVALLALPNCWVERSRPQPRRVDLRPYVGALRWQAGFLEMDLGVTPTGTARPQEILELLGLQDLLTRGGVFERSRLVLEDEESLPQLCAIPKGEGP